MKLRPHALWALAFALAAQLHAATFLVNSPADSPDANPGDGLAQDAAGNTTLRAAIMESNALPGPDEIQLPAAMYRMTLQDSVSFTSGERGAFSIESDVTIVGAGSDATVIDAMENTAFFVTPLGALRLSGVAVENAAQPTDYAHSEVQAAGVMIDQGYAALKDCRLEGCNHGVKNESGVVDLIECNFKANTGFFGGAAILNDDGLVSVSGSSFKGNATGAWVFTPDDVPRASAVITLGSESAMSVQSCTFIGNGNNLYDACFLQGGGSISLIDTDLNSKIVVCGGHARIERCRMTSFSVEMSSSLYSNCGDVAPDVTISDSNMSQQFAPNAVYGDNRPPGSMSVENSYLANGVYWTGRSTLSFNYCSIIAQSDASPIEIYGTGPVAIQNCLVAANHGPASAGIPASVVSGGHNLIASSGGRTDLDPSDILDVDPMFIHDYISIPVTGFIDRVRLLAGSPAIDAADPSGEFPATDYLGVHRPRDGDGNGSVLPDIGASEFLPVIAGRASGDFDLSGCTDLGDFLIVLDNWGGEYGGEAVTIQDFLNVLDYWATGAGCGA